MTTHSIPPATNTKELHTQKRRFAFLKLFELLCMRADCPNKPLIDISTAERAKALDDALDEFFSSEYQRMYSDDPLTPKEVQSLRFETRSKTPLFDYLRIANRMKELRELGELNENLEEEAVVELSDIREFMTDEQQARLSEVLKDKA
jgi:hypothetical protein